MTLRARAAGAQRHGQRRRAVRRARRPAGEPRARTRRSCGSSSRPRRQRAPFVRMADRYAGHLPARHAGRRRPRLGAQRRPGAGARRRGRRDAVPADPRRADRARVRPLARGARGVIVKGAGAIETLGQARTVLFDKTGTLTVGTPDVQEIVALGGTRGRGAAPGGVGRPAVRARARRGAACAPPRTPACRSSMPARGARGRPGQGIAGSVDGHRVAVGSRAFLRRRGLRRPTRSPSASLRGGARLRRGARARRRRRRRSPA